MIEEYNTLNSGKFGLSGKILISSSLLNDPLFRGSVVYVVSHTRDVGSVGVMLNKCVKDYLAPLSSMFKGDKPDFLDMHIGGADNMSNWFTLYNNSNGNPCLIDEKYLESSSDILMKCVGHILWGEGELEDEVYNNMWFVLNCNLELLLEESPKLCYNAALDLLGIQSRVSQLFDDNDIFNTDILQ